MIRKPLSAFLTDCTVFATAAAVLAASAILTGCAGAGEEGPAGEEAAGSPASPLSIEEAQELPSGEAVWVQGSLFYSEGELWLCSALAESYPPQRGGAALPVFGFRAKDIPGLTRTDPDREGPEVAWSDFSATLRGTLAEGTLAASLPPAWETTAADLTIRAGHLPEELTTGTEVNWLFDITNTSGSTVELTFPSGRQGDVVLSDEDGEAYRWSSGRAFTQAVRTIDLEPGQRIGFSLGDSLDVRPGTYSLEAMIAASAPELPSLTADITVQPRPGGSSALPSAGGE